MGFEKGNRANPGGRPRKTQEQSDFEAQCRNWARLFALDKLKRAADSKKAGEVIAAVKEICDRGFGKSEAISYLDANVTSPTGRSAKELADEIANALGAGAVESGGVPGGNQVDTAA